MQLNIIRIQLNQIKTIIKNSADEFVETNKSYVVCGDYGEHNAVVKRSSNRWQVNGVFDLMWPHFGDGNFNLCVPVAHYVNEKKPVLADEFILEYLRCSVKPSGFIKRQQLYMLGLSSFMWIYFQMQNGGPPKNPNALSRDAYIYDTNICFEEWAKPYINYWNRLL